MIVPTKLEDLYQLISDGIEESINLDYKSADALGKSEGKKSEIAKDVSAMANSAGGIIIYGIKEYNEVEKKHLPEIITPIMRKDYSKEWLEQVINSNISPIIENLKINSIQLDDADQVAYVVKIPRSDTAHQNTISKKYYMRYNFISEAMDDSQIRDVMNRSKSPIVNLDFELSVELGNYKYDYGEMNETTKLIIYLSNIGKIKANYINYIVKIPNNISYAEDFEDKGFEEFSGDNMINGIFFPILPGIRKCSQKIDVFDNFERKDSEIIWEVYADDASPRSGSIKLKDIKLINNLPPKH